MTEKVSCVNADLIYEHCVVAYPEPVFVVYEECYSDFLIIQVMGLRCQNDLVCHFRLNFTFPDGLSGRLNLK